MVLTIEPSMWRRLGKKWQKVTFAAKMPTGQVFHRVKRFFFLQLNGWMDIRSIQQMIYFIYHYKIRIATLKWWIVRRRTGREPDGNYGDV
jgi:hypothetical protein